MEKWESAEVKLSSQIWRRCKSLSCFRCEALTWARRELPALFCDSRLDTHVHNCTQRWEVDPEEEASDTKVYIPFKKTSPHLEIKCYCNFVFWGFTFTLINQRLCFFFRDFTLPKALQLLQKTVLSLRILFSTGQVGQRDSTLQIPVQRSFHHAVPQHFHFGNCCLLWVQSKQVTWSHPAFALCRIPFIKLRASTIIRRQSWQMRMKWSVSKAVYSDLIYNAFPS